MKTSPVVLAALLAVLAPVAVLHAAARERIEAQTPPPLPAPPKPVETPAPPPPPPPSQAPSRNVQVDVTVKLEASGVAPITKQMTLVAADQTTGSGRAGIDVAVPTMAVGDNKAVPSFNYRTVGLNVDVRPRIVEANKINVMVKLNFSSVLKDETATGRPSFGNASTELNLTLESGRPIVLTQVNDAELGRGYSVEVKATVLK